MIAPLFSSAFALSSLLVLSGCALDSSRKVADSSPKTSPSGESSHYAWFDHGGPGEVKVHIDLGMQRLYVARGNKRIGWSYVATGREGADTPAGSYRISEKIIDKKSNRYGWIENSAGQTIDHDASPGDPVPPGCKYVAAPMPYWMRITGYGIGLHAGYIPQPGNPASHGCIRLPEPFAPKLYQVVKVGTPVTIEYGVVNPWIVHPDPLPRPTGKPRTRNGLRVVPADDPWIVRD